MNIKKITLLFAIMCVGGLNSMALEIPYENTYRSLPPELKQEIIDTALATSNDLAQAITMIQKLSVLHKIDYNLLNNAALVNVLMKKFPATIKNVIIFAVEQPELYQKIDTILKNNYLIDAIKILKKENILQDSLKNYTTLLHIILININEKTIYPLNTQDLGELFHRTDSGKFTYEYNRLGSQVLYFGYHRLLLTESNLNEHIIKSDADINYSNMDGTLLDIISLRKPDYTEDMKSDINTVKLLLKNGANPYLKNCLHKQTVLEKVSKKIEELQKNPDIRLPKYKIKLYEEKLKAIKTILEQFMQSFVPQYAL